MEYVYMPVYHGTRLDRDGKTERKIDPGKIDADSNIVDASSDLMGRCNMHYDEANDRFVMCCHNGCAMLQEGWTQQTRETIDASYPGVFPPDAATDNNRNRTE